MQNRAARFVTGIYGKDTSITQIKKSLKWDDLVLHRKVNRLVTFHQTLGGHLAIPARNILRPVQRATRATSSRANNYINIATNKNCYKYSFIPRTLQDWNNLPKEVTEIANREVFKKAVNKYYNIKEEEQLN